MTLPVTLQNSPKKNLILTSMVPNLFFTSPHTTLHASTSPSPSPQSEIMNTLQKVAARKTAAANPWKGAEVSA